MANKTKTRPFIQIGLKVAELRVAKGLSQKEFAREAGVSISTLKDMERGVKEGHPTSRAKVAKALGVPVMDLYQLVKDPAHSQPKPKAQPKVPARPGASGLDEQAKEYLKFGSDLLKRFSGASPEQRAVVLAVLFDDASFVREILPDESEHIEVLLKAL